MRKPDKPQPRAAFTPSLPSEEAEVEARLMHYFDEVCTPLTVMMGETESNELRTELRAHLEERIAEYRLLGKTPEQAVTQALRQFGSAGSIRQAYHRDRELVLQDTGSYSASQATRLALALYALTCVPALYIFSLLRAACMPWSGAPAIPEQTGVLLSVLVVFLLPAPAGIVTGIYARSRPMAGTLYALTILSLPMMAFEAYCWSPAIGWWAGMGMLLRLFAFGWIPIGCVSAGLVGWLRKRTRPVRCQRA